MAQVHYVIPLRVPLIQKGQNELPLESLPDFTQLRHPGRVAELPHQFIFFAFLHVFFGEPSSWPEK